MPIDARELRRLVGRVAAPVFCCAVVTGCTSGEPDGDPAPSPSEAATPAHLPATQVRRLQDDLTSGVAARVRRAIEVPAGQSLRRRFVDELAGLGIVIDTDSAVVSGADQVSAVATVTLADGTDEQWQVTLDHLDGTYKIADTQRADP